MPIYEYECPSCNHRFAVLQRIGEGNETLSCELCGTLKPIKQFSSFAAGSSSEGNSYSPATSSKSPFT
ncbi:FmdB family transcriptional regulator [candidate division KSB3 bacterium]|uniref:FmdB family transcriptional regulator n=1 Tax=candidate division KSB3 bacterium TaxID=2044937 RepID=A0A2G6E5T6_9BACT|nr:MAG: FmdB family transcriptional regulator [candidate division KSB3 bacterium]PIE29777.1 MAG: FmdB family transcriptional regulator [candidate division KSB3 bacterium]